MSEPAEGEVDPQRSFDAALAAAGDRAAFVRLVRSTGRLVFSQVMLAVRDPHLAEDLTQETFLRAWRSVRSLGDPEKFNARLIGIARSVCVDHHRNRSRLKRAEPPQQASPPVAGLRLVDDRDDPATQLDQQERREQLIDALKSLPPMQQQVLSLRYLAGCDYDQIAAQTGLTDGQLRGHLSRGLAALRDKLRGMGGPPMRTGEPPVPRKDVLP